MERTTMVSLAESVDEVSDPRNLDASVEEVFRLMLGVGCRRDYRPPQIESESITAVVGFGGHLSGACIFRTCGSTAVQIAAQMTGMTFDEIDDTVKDAIGEICNMVAGVWKGRAPELAARCDLSVPAVITGRDYNLHVETLEFQIDHVYRFGQGNFSVTVMCDGILNQ
jgi:chemotaxis protein CheX